MKKAVLSICAIFIYCFGTAQEFNITCKVTTPKLNLVDPKVFKTLENTMSEFLNNTQWTSDEYEEHERIEGSLTLTILEESSPTTFTAEIRLQNVRPVFNSNYKTPLINIVDSNVDFNYTEYQPLEISDDSYTDNLSSILTFYAYMMLAYDYDTFAPLGGQELLLKAQNVMTRLPTGIAQGDDGWKTLGIDRNRYWFVENALNPRIRDMRVAMYEYHLKSLDAMTSDAEKSKAIMLGALTTIGKIDDGYPNSMIVQVFADTKREEIVEIFKDANRGQQEKVYGIMSDMDPAQSSLYSQIK